MKAKQSKAQPRSERILRQAACACATKASAEPSPQAILDEIGPGARAVGVDPAIKETNLTHLRRIEGQVRGIAAMVQDDRYCADVITQVMAVRESLNSVARNLMRNHLKHCASEALRDAGPGRDQMIEEILDLSAKLSR
ncbi:MAG: metal-sensitive transcriptional regulator [Planctomycetes bacterium]|nr:metal-sensitive transcriptional regulator [Planctomycetota bacterium]